MREGDRAKLESNRTGTIVRSTNQGYPFAIMLDDGGKGSNGDGACVRNNGNVTLIEEGEKIGELPSGEDVYEGARVEFVEYGERAKGFAVKDPGSPVGFAVQRDDRTEGTGPDRSWRIFASSIGTVRLI